MRRTPWIAISAMFVLNGALFGIWASRIPAVKEQHDLSPSILGLLLLLLAGGAILMFPMAGRMVDGIGAARTTRILAVAYVIALPLIAQSPDFWFLAVALFTFGACHGGMDVAMNAWGAEAERASGRSFMSSLHAMFSLGAGLGAASGWLAVQSGVSLTGHFAIGSLLIFVPAFWLAAIPWEAKASGQRGALFSLPKGALLLVGIIAFASSMGEGAMADWSAIFLTLVANAPESEAALGYAVFSITMVVVRLFGDIIIGRFGGVMVTRVAAIFAGAGVLLAVIGGSLESGLIGFALMGVGYAVVMPLAFSRAASEPGVSPGAGIASVATLGYGGLLLGPPVIGFLAEAFGLRSAFLLLAALAAVMLLLAGALRR